MEKSGLLVHRSALYGAVGRRITGVLEERECAWRIWHGRIATPL